jgi:hypothetical protein
MLHEAFEFVRQTNRPFKHDEARRKIAMLAKEIHDIYKEHIRRSTGKTCDICGRGDRDAIRRVHDCVQGYDHRPDISPVLCWNHYSGWSQMFSRTGGWRRAQLGVVVLSDEEVDILFAQFLAKQLLKVASQSRNKGP